MTQGPTTTEQGALSRVVTAGRTMVAAAGPVPVGELAAAAGCSPRQLGRDFALVLGVGPRAFGLAVRTGQVRRRLREHGAVLDAVFAAGFGSVRGFYETSTPTLGMPPRAFAAGGPGEVLRWTVTPTRIGQVLAVAGALGLCAARIGPDGEALLAEVAAELPAADLVRADEELAPTAAALRTLAEGGSADLPVPLDLRGTAFQARVWSALRRIPAGETRSYAEVARELGVPTAVRAVAGACAANRVALVVPCHRVVRSDGSLGGYRWGIEVKADLLEREARRNPLPATLRRPGPGLPA